jgi:hypothetical protein
LYPINVLADLNAVLGFFYLHTRPFDVSLADGASAPVVSTDPGGNNTYYFFHTQDLPLFAPLRQLGVPEALIDVVEPFFKALVDQGYDRSIPSWEPTPARLIPQLDPAKAAGDLVNAIGEGINNAAKLFGLTAPPHDPAPVNLAAPATETVKAEMSSQAMARSMSTQTRQTTVVDGSGDSNPADDIDEKIDARSELSESGSTSELSADDPASELSTDDSTSELSAGDSTTGVTASDPETTTESSSASSAPDDSSSTAGNSSTGDSSDSDADGST